MTWLVGGVIPGIERDPLNKPAPDEEGLLKLLHRWRDDAQWPRWAGPPSLILHSVVASSAAEKRNQHQHPESIHASNECRLRLHLLPDPLDRLIVSLRQ
jgi:hypothetical protein